LQAQVVEFYRTGKTNNNANKKSLLFSKNEAWYKIRSTPFFNVAMGRYDSAEVCELVGLYMLSLITPKFNGYIGLYRGDGLEAINRPAREVDKAKKDLCKIFRQHGLQLKVEANMKVVNFLDITLHPLHQG
jgi:hypothetical protein